MSSFTKWCTFANIYNCTDSSPPIPHYLKRNDTSVKNVYIYGVGGLRINSLGVKLMMNISAYFHFPLQLKALGE